MGTSASFAGAKLTWRHFLVTLFCCSKRVTRQWGETHNAKIKEEVNTKKKNAPNEWRKNQTK